jgi:hypothetical protein
MEEEMMQKSVLYNALAAIIPASLLSVVFLISAFTTMLRKRKAGLQLRWLAAKNYKNNAAVCL